MLSNLPDFEGRIEKIAATQIREFFAQEPPRRNMPPLLKRLTPFGTLVYVGFILLVTGAVLFILLNTVITLTGPKNSTFPMLLMAAAGFILLLWGLLRFGKRRNILRNGRLGTAKITGIRVLPMRNSGQIFYHIHLRIEAENGVTYERTALTNGQIIQHFFDIFDSSEQKNKLDIVYQPNSKSAILPLALIYSAKYVYKEQ